MNGIRLPDPIDPKLQALQDRSKTGLWKQSNREAAAETLRGGSPRYAPNYDIQNDPISKLRLSNNVAQTRGMGSNVNILTDKRRVEQPFNRPGMAGPRRVAFQSRGSPFMPEKRPVNYETQPDLNNTIGSDYTENISSVDSFEYKYYRTNDPDQLSEFRYLKPAKNVPHQSEARLAAADAPKPEARKSPYSIRREALLREEERLRKEIMLKERIATELMRANIRNDTARVTVNEPTQTRPCSEASAQIKAIGNKRSDAEPERPESRIGEYCQLSKEELYNGIGSIGLALSKVFRLTGKGVLYLCSSISDGTEGLFEPDGNEAATNRTKNRPEEAPTPHYGCNSEIHTDYNNLPDLHINYESDCCCKGVMHNSRAKRNLVYINGRRAETNRNYTEHNCLTDERAALPPGRYDNSCRGCCNRNDSAHPEELDDYRGRRVGYHRDYSDLKGGRGIREHHSGHLKSYNLDDERMILSDYPKIDCDGEFQHYEEEAGSKHMYEPYRGYDNESPRRNPYRERELQRAEKTNSRLEGRQQGDYSFEDKYGFDRPQYDIKNTEPATHAVSRELYDARSSNSSRSEINSMSVLNSRATEPRREQLSGNASSSKPIDPAKGRRNTVEVPSFGRPNVSAYGAENGDEVRRDDGPNDRSAVVSRRNQDEGANQLQREPPKPKMGAGSPGGDVNRPSIPGVDSDKSSFQREMVEQSHMRSEAREPMDIKSDLNKVLEEKNEIEGTEGLSLGLFEVKKGNDRISIDESSPRGSVDRISIGDENSDRSVDRISTGESDSSEKEMKKKAMRRIFPFYKGTKGKN